FHPAQSPRAADAGAEVWGLWHERQNVSNGCTGVCARIIVDLLRSGRDNDFNMKSKSARRERSAKDYPAVTHGSQVAARGRQKANKMSDAQREEYFRRGMVLIYGSGLP